MDLSVVIPLYNEDESIGELISWLEKVASKMARRCGLKNVASMFGPQNCTVSVGHIALPTKLHSHRNYVG